MHINIFNEGRQYVVELRGEKVERVVTDTSEKALIYANAFAQGVMHERLKGGLTVDKVQINIGREPKGV